MAYTSTRFSPHDLRHRRISLLHLGGVPWATIGQSVEADEMTRLLRETVIRSECLE